MLSWKNSSSALQRRTFWYYQARLRWVGQTLPTNTEELLSTIEEKIETEEPEVQWAMNFTACQIGVFQPEYRQRCIALGDEPVYTNMKWCQKTVLPVICPNSYQYRLRS